MRMRRYGTSGVWCVVRRRDRGRDVVRDEVVTVRDLKVKGKDTRFLSEGGERGRGVEQAIGEENETTERR